MSALPSQENESDTVTELSLEDLPPHSESDVQKTYVRHGLGVVATRNGYYEELAEFRDSRKVIDVKPSGNSEELL